MDDVERIAARRAGLPLIFGLAVVTAFGAALGFAQSVRERDAELQAVRKEIKALEGRVASQTAQRDESARALRAAELDAAGEARKLADLRGRLASELSERKAAKRSCSSWSCRSRVPRGSGECSSTSIISIARAAHGSAP